MISYFTVCAPSMMGAGASKKVGEVCAERGIKKVLFVFDKGIEKAGLTVRVKKSLEDAGIEYVIYDQVEPNPADILIEEGYKAAMDAGGIEAIIGMGGGSSMDTAKGINVLMGNGLPLSDYFHGTGSKSTKPGIPMFLIPTSSGTGSECSRSSIITNTKANRKSTIRSNNCCVATLAILDPELTVGSPTSLTVASGIDAFTHAAGALTVNQPNPVSDTLAMGCINRLYKYLPLALEDGNNLHVREEVALGSMLAGMAFANTMCHIDHSIAHALGAKLHLVHGYCCAAALPNALYYVCEVIPEQVRRVGEAMGLEFAEDAGAEEIGRHTAEEVEELIRRIKVPTLKDLGVTREEVQSAAELVLQDGCFQFLARPITLEGVREMLGKIYDGELYVAPLNA